MKYSLDDAKRTLPWFLYPTNKLVSLLFSTVFVYILQLFLCILRKLAPASYSFLLLTSFLTPVRFNETGILINSFLHPIILNVQLLLQIISDLFIDCRFLEPISYFLDCGEIWDSLWESQEIRKLS